MLHSLFGLTLDKTVHINDIINSVLTLAIVGLGHGLRKVYLSVKSYFAHIEQMGDQIEDTSAVVDIHTEALKRGGLAGGLEMPRVSKQRRREDRETLPIV